MDSDFRPFSEDLVGSQDNPFTVTKAVDFSDQEIANLWVDLGTSGGLTALAKPRSPMPMFITGGKGSGKTHLMRYLSFANQLIRYGGNVADLLESEGYIGIYVRFSGLNASRFHGKGQSGEVWSDVFSFYTELWLGQLALSVIADLAERNPEIRAAVESTLPDLIDLFTQAPQNPPESLRELLEFLRRAQRSVDHQINNCGFTGKISVDVNLNRGSLIFQAPRIVANSIPALRRTRFLYLLDEYEKLTLEQQKYVNTLVWEKELPSTIKVGTRTYGIRSYATVSAEEELREGSEYEELQLDARLRRSSHYDAFCRAIITRRLNDARPTHARPEFDEGSLAQHFVSPSEEPFFIKETQFVAERYEPTGRPHFLRLEDKLRRARAVGKAPGIEREEQIPRITEVLQDAVRPLAEKINVFLLYRAWARGKSLPSSAEAIRKQYLAFLKGSAAGREYERVVDKFQFDLLAQLLRECNGRQRYYGLDTFIHMSAGQPRNLLTILKHVYSWAEFRGEKPFAGEPISIEAQQLGVVDAADWFLKNARIPGPEGPQVHEAIRRLSELFREIRFSDKPSECSLVTFSVNSTALKAASRQVLRLAENWSLLLKIQGGQKDRNSMRIDDKYQLNPMLAPLWQLPVSRRGAIALEPREAEAIFLPGTESEFEDVMKVRLARMQAPFASTVAHQTGLFEREND